MGCRTLRIVSYSFQGAFGSRRRISTSGSRRSLPPVEPLGVFCGFKVKVGTYEPGDDYGSFEYRLFLLVQDAEGDWFASLGESPLEDEEEASDLEVQATWVPVRVWF